MPQSRKKPIPKRIRARAGEMLAELETWRLEVVLTPAPEPKHSLHMIRTVQSQNAFWYRVYCSENLSLTGRRKRPRTFIKRLSTIRGLKRLIAGKADTPNSKRLLSFIQRQMKTTRKPTAKELQSYWDDGIRF